MFSDSGLSEGIVIPRSVTTICTYAFYNTEMKNMTIPGNVEKILERAFKSCGYLEKLYLGSGLRSIGEECFLNCYALKSVVIPPSVGYIGKRAFGYTQEVTLTRMSSQISDYMEEVEYSKMSDFIVRGIRGTAAYDYAINNGFTFKEMSQIEVQNYLSDIIKEAPRRIDWVK